MDRCATCKFWVLDPGKSESHRTDDIIWPCDPVTYERETDEQKNADKWGGRVRACISPQIKFYERPSMGGIALVDASEYFAGMVTSETFGCTNHQPIES